MTKSGLTHLDWTPDTQTQSLGPCAHCRILLHKPIPDLDSWDSVDAKSVLTSSNLTIGGWKIAKKISCGWWNPTWLILKLNYTMYFIAELFCSNYKHSINQWIKRLIDSRTNPFLTIILRIILNHKLFHFLSIVLTWTFFCDA